MANTIVWLHHEEIIGKPIVPIWYSYIYFCIAVIILVIIKYYRSKAVSILQHRTGGIVMGIITTT